MKVHVSGGGYVRDTDECVQGRLTSAGGGGVGDIGEWGYWIQVYGGGDGLTLRWA